MMQSQTRQIVGLHRLNETVSVDEDNDGVPSRDKTDYNVWSTLLLATMKSQMAPVVESLC
jgi:hypothetical protein